MIREKFTENRGYKCDAFISYRHRSKDEKVARTLQKKLEQCTPPAQAAAEKKKLSVFLDDSGLSAGGDLWGRIHAKLAESKYLILVCSRETKESIYCMDEIRTFKELRTAWWKAGPYFDPAVGGHACRCLSGRVDL